MDLEHLLEQLTPDYLGFTRFSYETIASKINRNFATAPLVIEILLILIQIGSRDQSGIEIRSVLGHNQCPQEVIECAIIGLMDVLAVKTADFVSLHLAQKFYIKRPIEISENFKKFAKDIFDLPIENIDFSDSNKAAKTINRWVESETKNRVKSIITPEQLKAWTNFIAISALDFEGEFATIFPKKNTAVKTFYKNGNEKIQVEMMHLFSVHRYCEVEELHAKLLELQFKSLTASLVIILPNRRTGFTHMEKNIAVAFHVGYGDFSREYVDLFLPKFKIENTFDFKPLLKKAGIEKIFRMEETDLSGIGGKGRDLYVDGIIQKISFATDEGGVGLASPSAQAKGPSVKAAITEKNIKRFTVEHPFVFYVKTSDIIVLIGRVVDPQFTEFQEIQI